MSKIDEILEYWIGPPDIDPQGWSEKTKFWYASDPDLDNTIRERFGTERAAAVSLDATRHQKKLNTCSKVAEPSDNSHAG